MLRFVPAGLSRVARAGRLTLALIFLLASPALTAQSLQPGFFAHDAETISIDSARSGLVCGVATGRPSVCDPAHKVVITGEQTCDWSPSQQYPCTRFGYEFDYSAAEPGTQLDCSRTRYSPATGEQTNSYQQPIDNAGGRVFYSTFRTYAPVDTRVIQSEVHECTYGGAAVATIEFIIYYEPGVGGSDGDGTGGGRGDGSSDDTGTDTGQADPYFPEVPNACSSPYLTDDTAKGLLRAPAVRQHVASEHIPSLQSQCIYRGGAGSKGEVGYVFKFMMAGMFDVDQLSEQQINFNATFSNGGTAAEAIMQSPGRKSFLFRKGKRATLFVITGIDGPDVFGEPSVFVAQYYIDHTDIDFEARKTALLEEARRHMRHWLP